MRSPGIQSGLLEKTKTFFQDEQKENASIYKCFDKAKKGDFKKAKNG